MAEPGQDAASHGRIAETAETALPLSEEAARPLWLGALGTLLLHGVVAALLLWPGDEAAGGSGGAGGTYAIEVVMTGGGPAGSSPAVVEEQAEVAPTAPAPAVQPLTAAPQPPASQPPAPLPGPEPTLAAAEPPPPLPPVEATQVAAAAPPPPATPPAQADGPAPPPEKPLLPVSVPEPVKRDPAPVVAAATQPVAPGPQTAALPPAEDAAPETAGSTTPGDGATLQSPAAGSGAGTLPASVGDGGQAREAYLAKVMAWLQDHKRYPKSAERRRQQGVAQVAFTLLPDGQVSGIRLVAGSGYDLLDQEALALLTRAAPLPAFPPGLAPQPMALTLPVAFTLR